MALVGVSLLPSRSLTVDSTQKRRTRPPLASVSGRSVLRLKKYPGPPGNPCFDRGGSLRRHHVKQLELRPGRFNSRRFAWREKHAGAVLGGVRLAVEADGAAFRRLDDVDEVVVGAGLDVELAAFRAPFADKTSRVFDPHSAWLQIVLSSPDATGLASALFQLMIETSFMVGMGIRSWTLPQFADALAGLARLQHLDAEDSAGTALLYMRFGERQRLGSSTMSLARWPIREATLQ